MTINSALLLIKSITTAIKELKSAYEAIPVGLFLPPTKSKLMKLQDKINSLEHKINTGFPQIAQLVRSYSRLISDVRIAGTLSDKMTELYGLVPDLERFTAMMANDRQREYSQIASSINQLPDLDISEKGRLDAQLIMIRDHIRDLKSASPGDNVEIKKILGKLSSQYSDIEATLSSLLEKILDSFDIQQG